MTKVNERLEKLEWQTQWLVELERERTYYGFVVCANCRTHTDLRVPKGVSVENNLVGMKCCECGCQLDKTPNA